MIRNFRKLLRKTNKQEFSFRLIEREDRGLLTSKLNENEKKRTKNRALWNTLIKWKWI